MAFHRRRGLQRGLAVLGISATLLTALGTPASAASALTATGLAATVSGTSVTLTTTIAAAPAATAAYAGICVRSAGNTNKDLLNTNVALTTAGTRVSKTATFAAGTYSYWSCAKVAGVWTDVGAKKTFTAGVSAAPVAAPSGQAMPVGDLPGWKQIFKDDFTTNVALGGFPGPYAPRWASYTGFVDTTGKGMYNQKIISVQNGLMDLFLHKENGVPQVAAPSPQLDGWKGQLYGKYTARFRADPVAGYKTAWLLWPDSDVWAQGEVDYPDGQLNGNFWGFNHCINNPAKNCDYVDAGVGFDNWHTVSIEWSPKGVAFLLDGKLLKLSTSATPTVKMHWVLQTETDLANWAAISRDSHVQIDWVSVYSYTG